MAKNYVKITEDDEEWLPLKYTDIGHDSEKDVIWRIVDYEIERVQRGGNWTHELLWGKEIEKQWRGRFEVETGLCSVVAPTGVTFRRPPTAILNTLTSNFQVFRFYCYNESGEDNFSPNPRKKGR